MGKLFMTPKKDSLDEKQKKLTIKKKSIIPNIAFHNRKTFFIKSNGKWEGRHINGNWM